MAHINKSWYTSSTDLWATPQKVFDELNAEFHFTLDPCAIAENAKCARFFTPEEDGLLQDWGGGNLLRKPSIFSNEEVGSQMRKRGAEAKYAGRNAHPSANGYKLLSRLYLPQSRGALYSRPAEI